MKTNLVSSLILGFLLAVLPPASAAPPAAPASAASAGGVAKKVCNEQGKACKTVKVHKKLEVLPQK